MAYSTPPAQVISTSGDTKQCSVESITCATLRKSFSTYVWGPTHESDTHYLRIYMKQLRDKLEIDPVRPRHLVTETGIGYRLVIDE